ncbi:precorrin-6A synthase (deacetylating) [Pseudopelagicola sp. nBUS_19]|uniref:precorrin-6A synthase (deacetylating) n=1 Tax=unclassified Pseudopelagicola TaxID=2649563 RepID=UPI003EBEFE84
MIQLSLVGIGSGNPEHLTLEAIRVLESADLILLPRKGSDKSELADVRRMIARNLLKTKPRITEFDYPERDGSTPDYLDGVSSWHDALGMIWGDLIRKNASPGSHVALMVWGDPSLYDSTLRIANRVEAQGLNVKVRVVPGITSLQMLTAAHAIPLNSLGAAVHITTGRRLRDQGWPHEAETVVVMLDGECSFQSLNQDKFNIWWGAYVGMPYQILRSGALATIAEEIVQIRSNARTAHGWVMDIYLLRRCD